MHAGSTEYIAGRDKLTSHGIAEMHECGRMLMWKFQMPEDDPPGSNQHQARLKRLLDLVCHAMKRNVHIIDTAIRIESEPLNHWIFSLEEQGIFFLAAARLNTP